MINNEQLKIIVSADVKKLNAGLNKASSNLKTFGDKLTGIGKNLSTRLTLPIALAGGAAIKSASDFQRLKTSLEVLTGSAEKGAEVFERLVKFSAQTPFQLPDLVNVNNMLMGFGLNSEQAYESLKLLGDVAAVSGGNLENIARAFGQSAGAGRVMTQDINQFINNSVPLYDMLAKVTGKNVAQLREMASEGKITFDLLVKSFQSATSEGGKFNNGMERLSKTFAGQLSTFRDKLNITLAKFGEIMLPILTNMLKRLDGLIERFKNLSPQAKKLALMFGAVLAAIGPAVLIFGNLFKGLGFLLGGFKMLIGVLPTLIGLFKALTLAIASNPIGLIATAVVSLGIAFVELLHRINPIVSRFTTFLNLVKSLGSPTKFAALQAESLADAQALQKKETDDLAKSIDSTVPKLDEFTDAFKSLEDQTNKTRTPLKSMADVFDEKQKALNETGESLKRYKKALGGAGTDLQDYIKITSSATQFDLIHTATLKEKQAQNKQALLEQKTMASGLSQIFDVLDDNLQAIAETVGGVLVNSFEALLSGGNFFKTLIDGLKRLVVKLLAAAAAAFVLNSILAAMKLTNVPNVGALFSAFAGFSKMPAIEFANGGIVSGPTLGLMGEYSGARANPEVIAPLDKLKGMIGNAGSQNNVNVSGEFRLKGQDLVVALQRANKERNRIL